MPRKNDPKFDDDDERSTKIRAADLAAMARGGDAVVSVFELVVVDGPDRGLRVVLDGTGPARILIGQGPACVMRLSDSHVSRRHLALHHVGGAEIELTDLGSRNGTWVNGVRVTAAFLRGAEMVRIGDTTLSLALIESSHRVSLSAKTGFGRVLGASVEMRRLYPLFEKIAASDVPVVIEGETGTGKEVLAESLHSEGPRAQKPFMVFDCTTIAPSLVESELFGHERGAFTGATNKRKGIFELADGGTLFIDEIGDLDLALQPKLLRAIQRSEIRRVGGDHYIPVNVRVISATRRDLDLEVQEGRFRDDLFFRLAVARIELPPLRERPADVALLAQHFWKELSGSDRAVPYEVIQRCESHRWPGNVRELYNEISRRVALGELEQTARQPRASSSSSSSSSAPTAQHADDDNFVAKILAMDLPLVRAREQVVDEFQRRYVERILAKHDGNVTRAAAASGIAHRYFQILRARSGK